MITHSTGLDPSDIPTVPTAALTSVIDLIVSRGQALVLFHGACPKTRRAIEAAFWLAHSGDRPSGNATMIRFWHLLDALAARRVKGLLMERGYAALAPLAAAAASHRLNVRWGFKPQHLVDALSRGQVGFKAVPDRQLAA